MLNSLRMSESAGIGSLFEALGMPRLYSETCGRSDRGRLSPLEKHAVIDKRLDLTLDEVGAAMRKHRSSAVVAPHFFIRRRPGGVQAGLRSAGQVMLSQGGPSPGLGKGGRSHQMDRAK
jgi:hypothetical protein